MRDWTIGGAGLILGASLLACFAQPSARAQETTNSMTAIRGCLCARAAVDDLEAQVARERRAYEGKQREAEALTRTVADARAHLNTENRADIEAFTALLARRDASATAFLAEQARYATLVNRYNEAVNQNNAACVGRLFDPEQIEATKANLVCPRP